MARRPNPFTSLEGCYLSRTVGGIAFVIAFVGGAYVGTLVGGETGGRVVAVLAAILIGFTPWRRWLLQWARNRLELPESESGPPSP